MSETKDKIKILKKRRHPRVEDKLNIWRLISDSYRGGDAYLKAKHLNRHPLKAKIKYNGRKDRTVYINYLAPIVDILVGFIFSTEPKREKIESVQFLIDRASKKKDINSFMETVAIHSLLYTTGILVDSPKFNRDVIKTKADQEAAGLQPYCVLYEPWKIIDFNIDEDGELNWILLDNSYIDNSDPFAEAKEVKTFRLWTKDEYVDIIFDKDNEDGGEIADDEKLENLSLSEIETEEVNHLFNEEINRIVTKRNLDNNVR